MNDELKRDIIDGKIIDWRNLSLEELKKMKQECKQKEKDILDKINKTLEREADDL